jgi:hypothetical protein
MPRKPVLHEDDYLTGDEQVRLTVLVGERQFGSSVVFLDEKVIANGDIDGLKVGEGRELRGTELVVYTMVTDIRDNTDDVSVTWVLTGGDHRLSATETGRVAKNFGSQVFKGVFKLR